MPCNDVRFNEELCRPLASDNTSPILAECIHYCQRAESSVECACVCFKGELEISFARVWIHLVCAVPATNSFSPLRRLGELAHSARSLCSLAITTCVYVVQ